MAKCEELVRILSPFFENLQKMEKKLKCPVCLNLLQRPMLLPCDHVICRDCVNVEKSLACGVCDKIFISKDVRKALYVEDMVNIFNDMDDSINDVINQKISHHNVVPTRDSVSSGKETSHHNDIINQSMSHNNDVSARDSDTNDKEGVNVSASSDSCEEIRKENIHWSKRSKLEAKQPQTNKRTTPIGLFEDECAFCHSFRTPTLYGPIVCCINGRLVNPEEEDDDDEENENVIYVHQKCLDWAPNVYYSGDQVMDLEKEIKRGAALVCSKCGVHGAVLGCFYNKCRKVFHVTCALEIPDIRWDIENFNMLCPAHASKKLKCDDSHPTNFMDTFQENIQINEITNIEVEADYLVPEAPHELNKKTSNLFVGLGFSLSCYLTPSTRHSLEKVIIYYGGMILNAKDLCISDLNAKESSLKKYLVYNEDPPQDLSFENLEKVRIERTREVLDFARKTGSSRIVGGSKIYDAVSSLEKGILDEKITE